MGGKSGSSGYTNLPSWGWQQQGPSAVASPYYNQILQQAAQVAKTPFSQYQGPLVAGFSPMQQQAFQGIQNLQGAANPYFAQAQNIMGSGLTRANQFADIAQRMGGAGNRMITRGVQSDYNWANRLDPSNFQSTIQGYLSPYTSQVVNALQKNITETNRQQQQDILGKAAMSGAMGGDRAAVAQAELARQQDLAGQQTIAQALQQGYQTAADMATKATGLGLQAGQQGIQGGQALGGLGTALGGLGVNLGELGVSGAGQMAGIGKDIFGTGLQGLQALSQAGGQQQQLQQLKNQTAYNQWLQQQQYPYQQTGWLAQLLQGIGPLTGSYGQGAQYSPVQQQGSTGASILGGLASLLGLGSQLPMKSIFGMAEGGRVPRQAGGPYKSIFPNDPGLGSIIPELQLAAAHMPEASLNLKGPGERRQSETPDYKGLGSDIGKGLSAIFKTSDAIQLPGASLRGTGAALPVETSGTNPFSLYAEGGRIPFQEGGTDDLPPAVERYLPGLAMGETGGRKNPYAVVGPMSKRGDVPYGKYQVMGANVPSWTEEAGLGRMTPQEFLANPSAQEAVAKHKFGQYLKQTGSPEEAAKMWFGGPGYKSHPGARDVLGTSIPAYAARFAKNAGLSGATAAPAGALAYSDTGTASDASNTPGLEAIVKAIRGQREGAAPAVAEQGQGFLPPAVGQGLLAAGLGMMASRSPYLGQAIGEGGLRGLQAYSEATQEPETRAYRQAQLANMQSLANQRDYELALKVQEMQRAQRAAENYARSGAGVAPPSLLAPERLPGAATPAPTGIKPAGPAATTAAATEAPPLKEGRSAEAEFWSHVAPEDNPETYRKQHADYLEKANRAAQNVQLDPNNRDHWRQTELQLRGLADKALEQARTKRDAPVAYINEQGQQEMRYPPGVLEAQRQKKQTEAATSATVSSGQKLVDEVSKEAIGQPGVDARLANMERDYNLLNQQGAGHFDLLRPGVGVQTRAKLAAGINTAADMLGIEKPFDPKKIGAVENITKDNFKLSADLQKGMGREPGFILQKITTANPAAENTPEGFRRIVAGMKQSSRYAQERRDFYKDYFKTNNGDMTGVEKAFEKEHPLQSYIDAGNSEIEAVTGRSAATPAATSPAPAAGKYREGQTAVNPKTGERLVYRGGNWQAAGTP